MNTPANEPTGTPAASSTNNAGGKQPALSIERIAVSEMDNQCYFLIDGDEALLIDAAADADALLATAARHGARITMVLTTHSHWDHVRALKTVLEQTGATHAAAALDAPDLPAPVDIALEHGDTLTWHGHSFPIAVLRGHTTGGAALAAQVSGTWHLFVGDSLFPGGVGKTEDRAAFDQLLDDVTARLVQVYPDSAIVHPGHGEPTTLGAERPQLGQWRSRGW